MGNILVHFLVTNLFHGDAVIDWVAQGLDWELNIGIADIISLPIDGANWYSKALWVSFLEFWYGIGNVSFFVQLACLIEFFDLSFEFLEILNDEFIDKKSLNNWNAIANQVRKLRSCQI